MARERAPRPMRSPPGFPEARLEGSFVAGGGHGPCATICVDLGLRKRIRAVGAGARRDADGCRQLPRPRENAGCRGARATLHVRGVCSVPGQPLRAAPPSTVEGDVPTCRACGTGGLRPEKARSTLRSPPAGSSSRVDARACSHPRARRSARSAGARGHTAKSTAGNAFATFTGSGTVLNTTV